MTAGGWGGLGRAGMVARTGRRRAGLPALTGCCGLHSGYVGCGWIVGFLRA